MEPDITDRQADFFVEIKFEKDTTDPGRVFRAMAGLIESFEEMDKALIASIDSSIEPVLLLEDVETSSLRAWLAQRLRSVDDDGLKELNWKKIVGAYLVRAKYVAIDLLEGQAEITDAKIIYEIEDRVRVLAEETGVLRFPSYSAPPRQKLLKSFERMQSAVHELDSTDSVVYATGRDGERASFNLQLDISARSLNELMASDRITNTNRMILKVKKPDYLGESQWVFKHGGRNFKAAIEDEGWLQRFQGRLEDVRPGDSLEARVEVEVGYDTNGEVAFTNHRVIEIIRVVQMPPINQSDMFEPPGSEAT